MIIGAAVTLLVVLLALVLLELRRLARATSMVHLASPRLRGSLGPCWIDPTSG
jgi:hypothetical protein